MNGFPGTRYLTPEPGRDVGGIETSADVERRCPCCHERCTVTIVWDKQRGVETWDCHGCGGRKRYRVT